MALETVGCIKMGSHYEVFVDSIDGSDVLGFTDDELGVALAKADEWANEIRHRKPVVVVRVMERVVYETEVK